MENVIRMSELQTSSSRYVNCFDLSLQRKRAFDLMQSSDGDGCGFYLSNLDFYEKCWSYKANVVRLRVK